MRVGKSLDHKEAIIQKELLLKVKRNITLLGEKRLNKIKNDEFVGVTTT